MIQATLPIPALSEKDKRNFLKKISATPTETGCFEWMAFRNAKGYGSFSAKGQSYQAHRVAYLIATGTDPGEFQTMHTCDNPPCVNPEHLRIGTNTDNVRDKVKKGRAASGDKNGARVHPERLARGESNGRAKLKDSDIPLIRADIRVQRIIALDYGVDQVLISLIKRRKIWVHVA